MEHDPIDRSHDWFRQAERDLTHARTSRAAGHHEWACFAARQAAEKALKGLHLKVGRAIEEAHAILEFVRPRIP